jgi:excisionase family DNA binding protein
VAAVLGEPPLVDDPMLTAAQVAALLGVNQSTVQRVTRRGLLPVRGRGQRRFRLSDLDRVG